MNTYLRSIAIAIITLATVLSAACSSDAEKKKKELAEDAMVVGKSDSELEAEASVLYAAAHKALKDNDFATSIPLYERLARRYPFTSYASQGEIERIYALYRGYDTDKALSAADKFIREHPRHPDVDYVYYVKGLINFDRQPGFTDFLPFDDSRNDVSYERSSFDAFSLLAQKYPKSRYVGDARARMIYLRNRIAQHDLAIVDFYMRRGAYVAAAKRAEQIVAQYPGAPAAYEVLPMLEECYRRMGMDEPASDIVRLREAQGLDVSAATQAAEPQGAAEPEDKDSGFLGFHWWPFGGKEEAEQVPAPPPPAAP